MNEQTMIDLVNRVADNDKVAPFQNGFVVLTNEEMVKFAELIVRECLLKIELEASQYTEPVWAVELVNDIKEHFGVEE